MNFPEALSLEQMQEVMKTAAYKLAKQVGPRFFEVLDRRWTSHFVDLCDVFYEVGYKMLKEQTLPDVKVHLPPQKDHQKEMEVDAEGLRVFLLDVLHFYVGEHVAKTSADSFFCHYRRLKRERFCEIKNNKLDLVLSHEMGVLRLDYARKEAIADREAQEEAEQILLVNMENAIDAYSKNKNERFVVCLVQCLISETLLTFYSAAYNRAYQRYLEKENLLIN